VCSSSADQIPAALGPASTVWNQAVDAPLSDLGCAVTLTQMAQEATRLDYLHEIRHMRERVERLEGAITEAVKLASPALQQVINDQQALRGIADISAVTTAAELGQVSRFDGARQLMGPITEAQAAV
jgi:hypothetical protein